MSSYVLSAFLVLLGYWLGLRAGRREYRAVMDLVYGSHDPELCGCGSDAEWCPYNPHAAALKR